MTLSITRSFNTKTGVVEFQSSGQSDNPRINEAMVNLSRAGKKMYRLDNLQKHNTDAPGRWNDGSPIHSDENLEAYINRVEKEIAAAIEAASVNPLRLPEVVTVAVVA